MLGKEQAKEAVISRIVQVYNRLVQCGAIGTQQYQTMVNGLFELSLEDLTFQLELDREYAKTFGVVL